MRNSFLFAWQTGRRDAHQIRPLVPHIKSVKQRGSQSSELCISAYFKCLSISLRGRNRLDLGFQASNHHLKPQFETLKQYKRRSQCCFDGNLKAAVFCQSIQVLFWIRIVWYRFFISRKEKQILSELLFFCIKSKQTFFAGKYMKIDAILIKNKKIS